MIYLWDEGKGRQEDGKEEAKEGVGEEEKRGNGGERKKETANWPLAVCSGVSPIIR